MSLMASQITSLTIVYSTAYSGADQRKLQTPRYWPLWGNSPGTGEFPAQKASNAENVSIWWRHPELTISQKVDLYPNIVLVPFDKIAAIHQRM